LEKAKWTSATGKQGPRGRRGEGAGRAAGKWLANANHEPATPREAKYTTARASAGADEQRAPYQRCLFHIRHACIDRQHNVDDFRNHSHECMSLRRYQAHNLGTQQKARSARMISPSSWTTGTRSHSMLDETMHGNRCSKCGLRCAALLNEAVQEVLDEFGQLNAALREKLRFRPTSNTCVHVMIMTRHQGVPRHRGGISGDPTSEYTPIRYRGMLRYQSGLSGYTPIYRSMTRVRMNLCTRLCVG
jgi:hypothetical protein